MNRLRQIIRLYCQGTGIRTIHSLVGTSRNTIKKYVRIWNGLEMSYKEFSSKNDQELSTIFTVSTSIPVKNPRREHLDLLLSELCKRLKKKGVTKEMLHNEYRDKYPDGYSYSHFNHAIKVYLKLSRPIMHIEHKAGDKMYIDFAGSKLQITSAEGIKQDVEVFVAILGCSQLTYVEAVESQKKEDLIKVCENALHYFGGTPSAIVPDNLRSAVTKGSKYEAVLNEEFASFAEHYSITVVPARVYKPRDKSLVEGAVKLIYRSIYTRLEGEVFNDIGSLNAAISPALEIHNNKPFSGRNYSRRELYEEIERGALGTLNSMRYELNKQIMVTVSRGGYARLGEDIHFYSVPYSYVGKKVKLLYTSESVNIYYQYTLIACHKRDRSKYHYTTDENHLAPQHRYISEWTPENFIKQAEDISQDVASYISKVLEHKSYPDQAHKSCSGILSLARKVGAGRLSDACRWAENIGQYSYSTIEEILTKCLDQLHPEEEPQDLPSHDNIRGKDYYQ
ncbi:IS21 family transposase [Elizabethkingia anophelis]|uniref:IS21 family transposase n=1 Tax=Elizabethkingia anophelis TaxID=1117645 RepID=UPI0021A7BE7C